MRVQPLLALVRISLLPGALADAIAGTWLAYHGVFPGWEPLLWQAGASVGIYHGALALNDWRDREHDARTRPTRPIPSGAVRSQTAFAVGATLMLGGVLCAAQLGTLSTMWMAGIADLALLYTLAGRGPWLGPSLLAACRGGNLGAAAWRCGSLTEPVTLAAVSIYAGYVYAIGRLGRFEDGEARDETGRAPQVWLTVSTLLLLAAGGVGWLGADLWLPRLCAAILVVLGASGLIQHLATGRLAQPKLVEAAMGAVLRRMLLLLAAMTLATINEDEQSWSAWLAAACILSGYWVAKSLRRIAPPS